MFAWGIASIPLNRTEPLRAAVAREMAETGSFAVPRLYGEPFLTKPPGQYLAIRACAALTGRVDEVSARLPSVVASIALVLMIHGVFLRLYPRRDALLMAMFLPWTIAWFDKAPSAEIDMLLTALCGISILSVWKATSGETRWWMVSAWLSLTAATLCKWPAPAFFLFAVLPWLAFDGRLSILRSRASLVGLGLSVGVVALWLIAVDREVGASMLWDTVVREGGQRFDGDPVQRGRSSWMLETLAFPFRVIGANLPLALWAGWVVFQLRRQSTELFPPPCRRLVLLLVWWVVPNVAFWSLLPQHVLRYALPVTPAIAALGAIGMIGILRRARSERFYLVSSSLILLGMVLTRGAYSEVVLPGRTVSRAARENAALLRDIVPRDETLYIGLVREEGVLFYAGRRVRRLTSTPVQGIYLLLTEAEYRSGTYARAETMGEIRDHQKAPLTVVRWSGNGPEP